MFQETIAMRRQLAAFGVALAVMLVCFAPGALCATIVKIGPSLVPHQVASHHAAGHPVAIHPMHANHH
jgi:hypothetical protein